MYTNSIQEERNISLHQKVYQTALRNKFIATSEAEAITGNSSTARIILTRLFKRGQLLRIRGGLYAAVPLERVGSEYEVDRYLLIDKAMGMNGALAFHSALEIHGVAQSSFTTVYYLSGKWIPHFEFQDINYRVIRSVKLFGITKLFRDGIQMSVTDKERTVLDCIRRPDLCGGLEEYVKSIESLAGLSPTRLLDHLERFDDRSLFNRAGFILSVLKNELKVSDDLLQILKGRVSRTRYPLVPGARSEGSELNVEWNVLVPENFEEVAKFV